MPSGRSASRAGPVSVLTCHAVIALTCRPNIPRALKRMQYRSVSSMLPRKTGFDLPMQLP
jgi:hypothetical protein